MFRIDNSTSVATLPITPAAGTGRYFTNGNPVSGIPATVVDDWWTNMIQEEIITVVVNAGLTPSKIDRTQLWQAIQSMITGSASGPDYDPFLPLAGGTLYAPATGDLLAIQVDNGRYCRIRYTVAGTRTWMAGCDFAGNFTIYDLTANAVRLYVEPGGRTVCQAGLAVAGQASANALVISGGGIVADGQIYSGNSLGTGGPINAAASIRAQGSLFTDHYLYFNQTGTVALWDSGGLLYCNSNFTCAGQVLANTLSASAANIAGNLWMGGQIVFGNGSNSLSWDGNASALVDYGNFIASGNVSGANIFCQAAGAGTVYCNGVICNTLSASAANIAGNLGMGGQIVFGGGANALGWNSSGYLIDYGNFLVTGNLTTQQSLTVGTNMYCQAPGAGGVYCNGVIVDSHGVENRGNIRFIGGRWITWESVADSRPWAIAVAGDRWGVWDAASNGVEMAPVNRWLSVMIGGIQVDSGGQAWKAGGGLWADPSERRFKDDIEDYAAGLDLVSRLRPRSYTLNGSGPGHIASERRYVGLVVEEVEDVMPELLGEFPGDETARTIDATALIYAMVNSVRELSDRVQNLEGRT